MPTDDKKTIAQVRAEIESMREGFERLVKLVETVVKQKEKKDTDK